MSFNRNMTMVMTMVIFVGASPMREIKASGFKAKRLKRIDEVAETGDAIVVTKHCKAVVRTEGAQPKPHVTAC